MVFDILVGLAKFGVEGWDASSKYRECKEHIKAKYRKSNGEPYGYAEIREAMLFACGHNGAIHLSREEIIDKTVQRLRST